MSILKTALSVLLLQLCLANISHAEVEPFDTQIPITCGDTSNLLEGLKNNYGEEVLTMMAGKTPAGDDLFHSLWVNYQTKTWSFIAVNKQKGVTCVISSGDNLSIFFPAGI